MYRMSREPAATTKSDCDPAQILEARRRALRSALRSTSPIDRWVIPTHDHACSPVAASRPCRHSAASYESLPARRGECRYAWVGVQRRAGMAALCRLSWARCIQYAMLFSHAGSASCARPVVSSADAYQSLLILFGVAKNCKAP